MISEVTPMLEVRGLTKYFPVGRMGKKKVHALEDVSFHIQRGEVVALVGESGSGKSTTARLIARLMPPTGGKILLEGRDVLAAEPREASLTYRRDVQMIFQDPFGSLNPVHTIAHHLERPLKIHHKVGSAAELKERVLDLLGRVGLTPPADFAGKYPYELSGGQRQRVAIARVLAVDPQVILADEAVSMLDVSIRMGILNLLEKLQQEQGITFLYITHDIASARYFASRIQVMYAGQLVESAPSETLMQESAHPYTRLLLSAVPNPHAGIYKRQLEARGEVPSLIDPPPGCPFAPRCPQVMAVCRGARPEPVLIGADHWARCHLYQGQPTVMQAAESPRH